MLYNSINLVIKIMFRKNKSFFIAENKLVHLTEIEPKSYKFIMGLNQF